MSFQWMKKSVFVLCALMFVTNVFATTPAQVLQTQSTKLLNSLKGLKKNRAHNHRNINKLVDSDILPIIAQNQIAARVIGPVYWRKASPAQKQKFIREFKQLVVNTYAAALASYNDDQIKFYPSATSGRVVQVRTLLVRKSGQKIPISYQMMNVGGRWKVVDFSIENVSLVESYRNQFAPVLSSGGISKLITKLAKHNN